MSGGYSTGLWRFRHVICSIQFPVFVISEWNTKSFPWWAALSSFTIVGRCFLSPGSWWFVCIMECGFTIYFCYLTQLHNCLNNTGSLFAQGRLCNSLSKKSPSAKLMMHGLLFSIKYVIAVFFFSFAGMGEFCISSLRFCWTICKMSLTRMSFKRFVSLKSLLIASLFCCVISASSSWSTAFRVKSHFFSCHKKRESLTLS